MRNNEWHRDRIESLKFEVNKKRYKHKRILLVITSLLSVVIIIFIFELGRVSKRPSMIIIMGALLGILLFLLNWKHFNPQTNMEEKIIKNNYIKLLK